MRRSRGWDAGPAAAGSVAALLLGAVAVGSCFVGSFDVLPVATTASSTGASSAGGGGTGGAPGGGGSGGASGGVCVPLHPPGAPAASDPGPDTEDFVVALRTIDFAEEETEESGPPIGYDLDGVCTCRGDGDSCVEPAFATANHCDGPGGRDNAFALLVLASRAFNPNVQSDGFSAQLSAGTFGLLVRVWGYNGQPNDAEVSVAVYPSGGLDEDACAPGGAPAWNGEDEWPVLADAIVGTGGSGTGGDGSGGCSAGQVPGADLDDARFVDHLAYVADSVLVASPSELLLLLSGDHGPGRLLLAGPTITGRLERTAPAGPWRMREGVVAGRCELQQMWLAVGAVVNDGAPMCTDFPYYALVSDGVCRYPDIASDLSGPTAPCEGVSFGMAFEAEPARLGVVYRPLGAPPECPAGTQPSPLDCASRSGS